MHSKTMTSPDQIAEAVALRAAGYSMPAIADRLGVSIRTLHRVFGRHGVRKGEVRDELVQAARRDLIQGVTCNEHIRQEAGRLVADDLAHARLLRSRMADAAEHLIATNLVESVLVMRAAAAYSTAIKNTSDMLRHSMGTERAIEAVEAEDLPELVVREISREEALRMVQDNAEQMARTFDEGGEHSAVEVGGAEGEDDRVEEGADVACF